jgi:hypothetical protein
MRSEKPKSVKSAITLAELYKALYNACRSLLPVRSQSDPEAVRALRDHLTCERYGKIYDEMSKEELLELISELRTKEKNRPTSKMLRQLKFYMIAVGLVYCNMQNWEYIDEQTRVELRDEELRRVLVKQFYEGSRRLPESIIRRLYVEWINPKTNEFLVEGKFKKKVVNEERVHYERLTKEEVRYLISRYYMIFDNKINKASQQQYVSYN